MAFHAIHSMEGVTEAVRIRLLFEDRHMLSKSQRSQGLKRCWILLRPHLNTISDFALHLAEVFALRDVSPNGLLLSMDGFVLPPFESTCILKDKDIIRVNKKGGARIEVIRVHDGANHSDDYEIVEKKLVLPWLKLLAAEEFEKVSGGYQSEHEENEKGSHEDALQLENPSSGNGTSKKKRKRSNEVKLPSSKKKKTRSNSPEKNSLFATGAENIVHAEQNISFHNKGGLSRKIINENEKSVDVNGRSKIRVALKVDDRVKENVVDSASNEVRKVQPCDDIASRCLERDDQLREDGPKNGKTSQKVDGMRKFPSRSARRKKAKRQWLRELAKSARKEEVQSCQPENNIQIKSPECQQTDQDVDTEEENIVPIVVKPGHIRFEPLDEALDNQQSHDQMENFQWNGTTSKKKGQKWGKQKTWVCRREGSELSNEKEIFQWKDTNGNDGQKWVKEKNSEYRQNEWEDWNKRFIAEGERANDPVDFENLEPLTSLPKEGAFIAYRLVELHSSWCPELSPFRVGKVSSYDPVSKRVTLLPVSEYPIVVNDNEEADASPSNISLSLYNEDGSLEIEFESLVDARIINHEKPDQLETVKLASTDKNSEALISIKETTPVSCSNDMAETMPPPSKENGGQMVEWEEISRALSEKKAELSQREGDIAAKEVSTPKSGLSYKALRGSALGPTIAFLRAQNSL